MACWLHETWKTSMWRQPFHMSPGYRPAMCMRFSMCAGAGDWKEGCQGLLGPLFVPLWSRDLMSSICGIKWSHNNKNTAPLALCTLGSPPLVTQRVSSIALYLQSSPFCQQDICEAWLAHQVSCPPETGTSPWSPQDTRAAWHLAGIINIALRRDSDP